MRAPGQEKAGLEWGSSAEGGVGGALDFWEGKGSFSSRLCGVDERRDPRLGDQGKELCGRNSLEPRWEERDKEGCVRRWRVTPEKEEQ